MCVLDLTGEWEKCEGKMENLCYAMGGFEFKVWVNDNNCVNLEKRKRDQKWVCEMGHKDLFLIYNMIRHETQQQFHE